MSAGIFRDYRQIPEQHQGWSICSNTVTCAHSLHQLRCHVYASHTSHMSRSTCGYCFNAFCGCDMHIASRASDQVHTFCLHADIPAHPAACLKDDSEHMVLHIFTSAACCCFERQGHDAARSRLWLQCFRHRGCLSHGSQPPANIQYACVVPQHIPHPAAASSLSLWPPVPDLRRWTEHASPHPQFTAICSSLAYHTSWLPATVPRCTASIYMRTRMTGVRHVRSPPAGRVPRCSAVQCRCRRPRHTPGSWVPPSAPHTPQSRCRPPAPSAQIVNATLHCEGVISKLTRFDSSAGCTVYKGI